MEEEKNLHRVNVPRWTRSNNTNSDWVDGIKKGEEKDRHNVYIGIYRAHTSTHF